MREYPAVCSSGSLQLLFETDEYVACYCQRYHASANEYSSRSQIIEPKHHALEQGGEQDLHRWGRPKHRPRRRRRDRHLRRGRGRGMVPHARRQEMAGPEQCGTVTAQLEPDGFAGATG